MRLPEQTVAWGRTRSCIRELAEYGAVRKGQIGKENVFDFSIGNPSIPAPESVNAAIAELIRGDSVALHGYTTAAGRMPLREKIAKNVNDRFGLSIDPNRIYVTCGAAAALTISLKALLFPGDEVLVMAPFFPEYRVFTESVGGSVVVIPPRADLQPDLEAVRAAISEKTRAVILNSPNNPSGAILSVETLKELSAILEEAQKNYGREIFVLSDEPYRDLVYTGEPVHSALEFYDNAIMCFSWSKSLSIPGERIGYIALNGRIQNSEEVYHGILGAGRALGFVNPPSLFQQVLERCLDDHVDASLYKANRDLLCAGLDAIGYEYVKPEGAFYLFLKALEPDAKAFSDRAKAHELLLVPSDDFGVGGYVRISYCVSKETIERSMPAFRALFDEYKKL